jgi:hypothetical protein
MKGTVLFQISRTGRPWSHLKALEDKSIRSLGRKLNYQLFILQTFTKRLLFTVLEVCIGISLRRGHPQFFQGSPRVVGYTCPTQHHLKFLSDHRRVCIITDFSLYSCQCIRAPSCVHSGHFSLVFQTWVSQDTPGPGYLWAVFIHCHQLFANVSSFL